MIKALKCKKGMTLTEIIVGGIMFAIFTIAISLILSPMVITFMRANDFAEYNKIMDSVGNQIINDMSKATGQLTSMTINAEGNHVVIPPGTHVEIPPNINNTANQLRIPILGSDDVEYTIVNETPGASGSGGTLMRNDIPVFPEGFYKGKQVNFDVVEVGAGSGVYSIRIFVMPREGGNTFGISGSDLWRDYVARPLVLINDTP